MTTFFWMTEKKISIWFSQDACTGRWTMIAFGCARASRRWRPGRGDPSRCVGWAARRGPVFTLGEPGPFPGSLPPNPACTFQCTGLSSDLCRVRDGVRVDPVMAGGADDERLAPHFRHEGGPRGLARSRLPELLEAGDLVDCHRGAGLAELAFPFAEPSDQLLAGVGDRDGRGVTDDRPPVLPQDDPAESCYQVLLALAVLPGLEAGPAARRWSRSWPCGGPPSW